ncbi:MAG: 23S rRNA (guanosine(2251)-2'-O)-methyltransferase RlmB [Fusobacteriia bacterium 4572_132]|nr:MAG: 23S rRNA (guanosine(2251)-2'-O)-methyltransferase RlmB [Fusobacteriia bacterium 4572_132]
MKKIIGINPVREILKRNEKIEKLEIFKGVKKETISEILDLAKKGNIKIFYTQKREENSQGVVVYVNNYNYYMEEGEFLEKVVRKEKSTILILDGVQDPRNLGALLRSAEAFNVDGIIIPERKSAKINEAVIKTSTGAIEYVDIVKVENISKFIEKIKKLEFWIYGAEANEAKLYYEENYPKKTCLVLGSEGFGIRKKVKKNCDIMIKIPMLGKVNSLNVSVAGGILLSEISKNRRG